MRNLRPRLTYANVVASIALFLSLGAVGWAAFKLPKNSVRSVNIVKGGVKRSDIGKRAVNGPRVAPNAINGARVADSSLTGTDLAPSSVGATRIAPPETPHRIGAAGEPQFYSNGQRTWTSLAGPGNEVDFYRDQIGNVHLEGTALCFSNTNDCDPPTAGRIFTLPPGYRPEQTTEFLVQSDGSTTPGTVAVYGLESPDPGDVFVLDINTSGPGTIGNVSLDSIDYRAAG